MSSTRSRPPPCNVVRITLSTHSVRCAVGCDRTRLDHTALKEVDFLRPPLNEVVFSVQFEDDVIDEVLALSRFWPDIQEKFPNHEKQSPLPPVSETFQIPSLGPAVQFQMLSGPPSARYWFLTVDGTKIVQVQPDRLIFNWRQVEGNEPYPGYDQLLPEFLALCEQFRNVLSQEDKAAPPPAWCELTYINPIPIAPASDGTHGQLATIINYLEANPPRVVLPTVEDTQIQQRFRILNDAAEPIGRLYMTAVPGYHKTGQSVYVVTMLARGRPEPAGDSVDWVESARRFFDRAHKLIVHGFKEVTTPAMHAEWEEVS